MPVASIDDQIPEGFELRHTFHIPEKINRIAWSPDGQTIALPSRSEAIQLWDVNTEVLLHTFKGNFNYCVAWSPDGQTLASGGVFRLSLWDTKSRELRWRHRTSIKSTKSLAWSPDGQLLALAFASDSSDGIGSSDGIIEIWNVETQQLLRTLTGHTDDVNSVEWSPNGKILASGSNDNTVRLWDIETGELIHTFVEHFNDVNSVTWSSNGKKLASASSDNTVRLWDVETKRQNGILEGHVKSVISVSFSYDARLLASKSLDGTVRLWRLDNLDVVTVLLESSLPHGWYGGLAFHPKRYMLATLGEMDEAIRIWKLNLTTLLGDSPALYSFHYKNAKVILVGDSGVGKSGLSLVLTNQPFVPTESTHSRHVWQFDIQKEELDNEHIETHETFLWDLAGQPGYRLTHQLYLNEVAVALIVFDARSETDPFAGVYHWERVLRLIEQIQKNPLSSMKRFLVAARVDRGGISVSQKRIDSLKNELKFNDYFETSAKEDQGIVEIIESIKKRINWDIPPKVSSFDLFQNIKKFIATMRETGLLLCTIDSLYSSFLVSKPASEGIEDLRDQFNNCIKHLEAGGLIQELKFGNFVLLKPELLDSYAAALVNSVKDEPDGLGSILEEKALTGTFTMPEDERLQEKEQEKLLLIAMVKHLLHYEIALREVTDDGVYLVFPSQSTREYPTSSNLGKKALIFNFEGPVLNIYSTLVVRLSHSGIFTKKELWKDVVTFTYRYPDSNQDLGTCGILLRNFGEGSGELTIYFDMRSNAEMRFHLENYVNRHLQSQALVESFKRRDVFVCERCGFEVPDELVHVMLGSYFSSMNCPRPNCKTLISLESRVFDTISTEQSLVSMNVAADAQREDSVNTLIRQGEVQAKIHDKDFDVFLSYNSGDRSQVRKIYNELKYRGVAPWFDDEEVPPGRPWLRLLEEQIENIKTAAVFIGNSGIGPWHQQEMEALLREFVNRKCPVIPVFLASAPEDANFPIFLRGMTEVDFRKPRLIQDHNADEEQGYKFEYPVDTIVDSNLEPIDRLVWGITGNRSTLQGERKMTLTPKTTRPIEIFISYARKDQRLRDQLETHLSSLKREGLISTWYDRKIGGGEEWAGKINEHLTMAHIILLLVSPDFIASEYCNDVEVKRALERYAAGDAHVIPVILRRVDWESTPLGKLQALPRDAKPVTSWTNRDDAFFDVAQGIRRVVKGQIATPLHMHDLASTQLSIRGFRPPINPRTIQQRKKVVHEVYAKLIRPDITAIVLTGIGGAGKSVLAALVSDYAEKRQNAGGSIFHDKPLWLRIDNGFKMADLVRTTLESLGKPISNIGNQTPLNQAVALFDALDRLEKPRLVVFDQFENLLDWQTGQSLTDQPGVGEWLDVINSQKCTCRILLTSRPWPEGNQVYSRTYMQEYPIKGLESMEGIELLQKQGVKGTDAELREAVRRCEGHALALTLLASLLRGDPSLSIGRLLDDNDPFYAQLWSGEIADKLLDMIYKGQLDEAQRKLLQAFSVYREPVALEAALAIIAEVSRAKLMKARRVLLTQHLLQAIGEGEGRYQLHAIVAEYAQAHFDENNEEANKEALRSAHAKAAQYYQKQAEIFCPPPEKRRSVSDVQSLIEMVWQLCQAEEWQQVYALMEREDLFMHLKRCGSNAILLELYQLLLPLEKWQPESLQKARIYSDLGDIYKAFGRIPQALENLEQALDIYKEKRDRRENWVLNNLGRVYSMRGQIEQAKQYFEEALVISRQKGDRGYSEDEITTLNELAEVYIAVGQKDKSLEYSEQALSISKEIKDSGKEATTFKNLGIVYSTVGKKEQAKRYYEEALKIQRERGIRGEEGKTLNSLGELYNDLGQKEEALKNFDQALSKRKEVGDRLGEGKTLWNIGVLFLEKAHYHVALACFLLARKIFEEIQSPHRDEVQKRMDDLRGNVGDEQYSIMLKKVASRAPQIVEQALLLGL